jgi:hypothetical protein
MTVTLQTKKAPKGAKMTSGSGWRLVKTTGTKQMFVGSLIDTINFGNRRLAIFSVPKR